MVDESKMDGGFLPMDQGAELASNCFISLALSNDTSQRLRLMIDSLRAFGGDLSQCPIWIFWGNEFQPQDWMRAYAEKSSVSWIHLADEKKIPDYYFAKKVLACAQAEEIAGSNVRSLIWLDPNCLIIQPPLLFDLAPAFQAAFRPVHIQNVGLRTDQPVDEFWAKVYRTIGVEEIPFTVQSFVDSQTLRPYFNTHLFAVDPARGVLRAWEEYFSLLVADQPFQSEQCNSELKQIFLHQVVLSALVTKMLPVERIRLLPPEYSYPLHLQETVPQPNRIEALNEMVCAVYEEHLPHQQTVKGIEIREPLYSWLINKLPPI